MRSNTIKWRIFKYNLIVIVLLIALVAVIFNVTVRLYLENEIMEQLEKIASRTEDTALKQGPDFFPRDRKAFPPPPQDARQDNGKSSETRDLFRYYFLLDRSLRQPLSVLNASYILLDSEKNVINPLPEEYYDTSQELINKFSSELNKLKNMEIENYLSFNYIGTEYIAIVKPVSQKNNFGLGWIVIYSSLQKVNQLQLTINLILLAILLISALIMVLISSLVARKISEPFSTLNNHIRSLAERNFGTKINTPVYDELSEFVSNINIMSEKLETYDKAQKTFLQNASHEFRTPLMSIQSYAEGIKYGVTDSIAAADIIIDESRKLTQLVENLLYLSRLDAIEENYNLTLLDFKDLISGCIERISSIASKNNIRIEQYVPNDKIQIHGDEEKLSRAITNVLSNCIRYAESKVFIRLETPKSGRVTLEISDDGPGFEEKELPHVFDRFYKGAKGNFGLGLAITKNVIEKHSGEVCAENKRDGAVFKIILPSM